MKGRSGKSARTCLAHLLVGFMVAFLAISPCRAAPATSPSGKTPEQAFREAAAAADRDPAGSLRAYLELGKQGFSSPEFEQAVQRLAGRALRADGAYLFPVRGWEKRDDALVNPAGSARIRFATSVSADVRGVSRKAVADAMPPGMFTEENLTHYDVMRRMAEEVGKAAPDVAQGMKVSALPVLESKEAGKMGGVLTLASASGIAAPGVRSACSLAFRAGQKTYLLTWAAVGEAPSSGEELLTTLLDSIVFTP